MEKDDQKPLPTWSDYSTTAAPTDDGAVVEDAVIGAVAGGLCAVMALAAGAFLGAIGARLAAKAGADQELGGGLTAFLAAALLALMAVRVVRPPRPTVISLAVLFAPALYWAVWVAPRTAGTFYPWALAALPIGLLVGPWLYPIYLANGGDNSDLFRGRGANIFYVALFVADLLKWVNRRRPGCVLGGAIGGAAGSAFAAMVVAWSGGAEVAGQFGGFWVLPIASGVIAAGTGAAGGWATWAIYSRRQVRLEQMRESSGAEP